MQASAVQHAVNDLVSEVSASVAVAQARPAQDVAMDVDIQAHRNDHNAKRKAEDELAPEDAKKVHVGEPFSRFNVVTHSLTSWAEAKSVPLKRYSSHSGFILCGLSLFRYSGIARIVQSSLQIFQRQQRKMTCGLCSKM